MERGADCWLANDWSSNNFVFSQVKKEGEKWTITTSTMLKSMTLEFELGKEFDESTPDGRAVTSKVVQEGDKLICTQTAKDPAHKSTKSTREFFDDKCVLTIEIIGTASYSGTD